MKLNYFVLGAIAIVAFGSTNRVFVNQNLAQAEEVSAPHHNSRAMTKEKSGTFVAGEHSTQGTARLIQEKGKRYVEFDKAFKSEQGPDLYVILHRASTLPNSGLKQQDYLVLGRLQKVNGTQRYAIPNNINLANYGSVAIWCRAFNATFGYAPLQATAQVKR